MGNIKMVALRRHPFGVGHREAGEEYDADANEAKILTSLGWAREAKVEKVVTAAKPAAKKATKQTYQTRDLKAKE